MTLPSASIDHVVVIGASAGGLEAIEELIAHLPLAANAAYVVAQHLARDHPSQLVELLQRATRHAVVKASDRHPLQAGEVVVIPPDRDAVLSGEHLCLMPPEPRFKPSPSIDRLFESLAAQWGDRAVAIVLSGTGSDGACGMRTVSGSGGLTLVQLPETARFDGMPRAAIALSRVDLVADPAGLGARLSSWFRMGGEALDPERSQTSAHLLTSVALQLKQCTGVDVSQYKETTLRRQILRRMAVRGVHAIDDYLALLMSDPAEGQALLQNLLITVTSFFRNPDAFASLERPLATLIQRLPEHQLLRVWVPGCATGEEAYSIGMLVSDLMGHPPNLSERLKIFATDLDERSLTIARRGVYTMAAARAIPEALFEHFSVCSGDEFEVVKDLRSCIVFARHNVSEDPPFPNVDLISFRNALIYFTSPLQERVIDLFGFSLNPGGLLFLGSSEALTQALGFKVINQVHRIYERNPSESAPMRLPLARTAAPSGPLQPLKRIRAVEHDSVPEQHVKLLEALVRTIVRPCLVVDDNHDLIEVIGDVSPFCKMPQGPMSASAGGYLREELQSEARALLLLVRADRRPARSGRLQVPGYDYPIRLEAAPLQVAERELTLLSFIEDLEESSHLPEPRALGERDAAFAREVERLERELLASQDSLRRSMADLEQVNEELEASAEELQASSEELQASNQELEASNEELQATNEELAGLNQKLRARSHELEHLNIDLENIQCSLSQGMVIVDENLRITRFSPLAVRLFGLVDADCGRPLIGVPTTMPLPGLRDALLAVLNGEDRRSIEASGDDLSYLVQIMPYRNRERALLGAIVTLTDVSELVDLRRSAEASLREFVTLADALEPVVWKRDLTLNRMVYLSDRVEALTGWTATQLFDDPSLLEQAIHPDDRSRVNQVRSDAKGHWSVDYRLFTRNGELRTVQEVGTVLAAASHDDDADAADHAAVGTLVDITRRSLDDQRNRLLLNAFDAFAAADQSLLVILNQSLEIVFAPPFGAAGHQQRFIALLQSLQQNDGGSDQLCEAVRQRLLQVLRSGEPMVAFELSSLDPALAAPSSLVDVLPLGQADAPAGLLIRGLPSPAETQRQA
jgi:two-component system CheB/CheR fusion protein